MDWTWRLDGIVRLGVAAGTAGGGLAVLLLWGLGGLSLLTSRPVRDAVLASLASPLVLFMAGFRPLARAACWLALLAWLVAACV
jgi:hypothetical protein